MHTPPPRHRLRWPGSSVIPPLQRSRVQPALSNLKAMWLLLTLNSPATNIVPFRLRQPSSARSPGRDLYPVRSVPYPIADLPRAACPSVSGKLAMRAAWPGGCRAPGVAAALAAGKGAGGVTCLRLDAWVVTCHSEQGRRRAKLQGVRVAPAGLLVRQDRRAASTTVPSTTPGRSWPASMTRAW
jgi:hypothetical protein